MSAQLHTAVVDIFAGEAHAKCTRNGNRSRAGTLDHAVELLDEECSDGDESFREHIVDITEP